MSAPQPNPARERHWVCAGRMRDRRLALGLTQRQVVERLERRGNRTTNRALSAMENGRGLDLGLLPELAASLDCTVTYLLGLSCDPHSWRPDRWAMAVDRLPAAGEPAAQGENRAAVRVAGVLGPEVPNGFSAPGRDRRRGRSVAREASDN